MAVWYGVRLVKTPAGRKPREKQRMKTLADVASCRASDRPAGTAQLITACRIWASASKTSPNHASPTAIPPTPATRADAGPSSRDNRRLSLEHSHSRLWCKGTHQDDRFENRAGRNYSIGARSFWYFGE